MTHKKVVEKFKIEYDKADIISSYPSLTDYEIATILDKAYLALIAQKITGNNQRRSTYDSDIKSIEDLKPLVTAAEITFNDTDTSHPDMPLNGKIANTSELSEKLLYFVGLSVLDTVPKLVGATNGIWVPVKLISKELTKKFFASKYNTPWVKDPVCYILGDNIVVVYDYTKQGSTSRYTINFDKGVLTYIKAPDSFINTIDDKHEIEINDTMVEELINLAIVFTLENVESPRLNTKINMKGLEA